MYEALENDRLSVTQRITHNLRLHNVSPRNRAAIRQQRLWYHRNADGDGYELAHRWTKALDLSLHKRLEHPTRYGPAPENSLWNH